MKKNIQINLSNVCVAGLKKDKEDKVVYLKKDGKDNSVVLLNVFVNDANVKNKDLSKTFWLEIPVKTGYVTKCKESGLDLTEKVLGVNVNFALTQVTEGEGKDTNVIYRPAHLISVYKSEAGKGVKQELGFERKKEGEYNPIITFMAGTRGFQKKKDGTEVVVNKKKLVKCVISVSQNEVAENPTMESTWLNLFAHETTLSGIDANDITKGFGVVTARLYHTKDAQGYTALAFGDLEGFKKYEAPAKTEASVTIEEASNHVDISDDDLPF